MCYWPWYFCNVSLSIAYARCSWTTKDSESFRLPLGSSQENPLRDFWNKSLLCGEAFLWGSFSVPPVWFPWVVFCSFVCFCFVQAQLPIMTCLWHSQASRECPPPSTHPSQSTLICRHRRGWHKCSSSWQTGRISAWMICFLPCCRFFSVYFFIFIWIFFSL